MSRPIGGLEAPFLGALALGLVLPWRLRDKSTDPRRGDSTSELCRKHHGARPGPITAKTGRYPSPGVGFALAVGGRGIANLVGHSEESLWPP